LLNKDFKEFIESLRSNAVDFLVVGAHALAAHGKPRYTGDLDIWVRPEKANIERLLSALNAFGFGSLGLNATDFETPEAMVQLGYPPARIDLLTAIDGVKFDEAFAHKLECDVSGILLPVISIDDLIRNKLATGRPKDLADVDMLRGEQNT
jgi:Nucleotidyl transferase of unknown function (DUF2204)